MSNGAGQFFRFEASDEYYFEEGCYILEMLNDESDPAISVARARVPSGVTTRWHSVSGTAERYLIETGEGFVEVGTDPARNVGPGDVILIPPGVAQRIFNPGPEPLIFLALCTPRFEAANYIDLEA